jgi:hypothetical protein
LQATYTPHTTQPKNKNTNWFVWLYFIVFFFFVGASAFNILRLHFTDEANLRAVKQVEWYAPRPDRIIVLYAPSRMVMWDTSSASQISFCHEKLHACMQLMLPSPLNFIFIIFHFRFKNILFP